jgi:ADP-heptose:LPS heptosyltransferase
VSRSLLVAYRALGLGDLLTGIPALRALARAFPEHRRVLAAPRALAPLALLSGAIAEVEDTAPLAPLPEALHGADVAVNLHGRGPESHALLRAARPRSLIAFGAGAPNGGDAALAGAGHSRPVWREGEHEVARWCRLLEESGIPADPRDLDLPAPEPGPLAVPGATIVHPGAASGARRWPAGRWAEVARAAPGPVLITGGPGERELAADVARRAGLGREAVLAGRTSLLELAGVVGAAGRVACGDTGVAHLATALGVPSVILFGPTPPAEWGPPPDRPRHRALWAGRRGDPHAGAPDPGLLAIGVADVVEALTEAAATARA